MTLDQIEQLAQIDTNITMEIIFYKLKNNSITQFNELVDELNSIAVDQIITVYRLAKRQKSSEKTARRLEIRRLIEEREDANMME